MADYATSFTPIGEAKSEGNSQYATSFTPLTSEQNNSPTQSNTDSDYATSFTPVEDTTNVSEQAAEEELANAGRKVEEVHKPATAISDPQFLPQASVEVTRGLLQSGESLANIAQGVTNLATLPFTPFGVRAPQVFKQASDAMATLEENLPESNIQGLTKFGLNMLGGAPIGIGEYEAANAAVKGLSGITTAGKLAATIANPASDAYELMGANIGLKNLPGSQKIIQTFLTDKTLSEGTKMAMIGALNDYGQTDEVKDLAKGAGGGLILGSAFGAGGQVFDKAVDLMRDNGKGVAKKWLQGVLGNQEVIVNGQKVKLADDFINNPGKYSTQAKEGQQTAEEFKQASDVDLQELRAKQQQDLETMRQKFTDDSLDKTQEFRDIIQQNNEARDELAQMHNDKIAAQQEAGQTGLFQATQQKAIDTEEGLAQIQQESQSRVQQLQDNVAKAQANLQSRAEGLMAEVKATADSLRTTYLNAPDKAWKYLTEKYPNLGIHWESFERDFNKAISERTREGQILIQNKGELAGDNQYQYGVPGKAKTPFTEYLGRTMRQLSTAANENDGKIPIGQLDLVRKEIRTYWNQALKKGDSNLSDSLQKIYHVFQSANYMEEYPQLRILKAANEAVSKRADQFAPIEKLFFTNGQPNADRALKAVQEGGGQVLLRLKQAEEGLPEKLKIADKLQKLAEDTNAHIVDSKANIESVQSAMTKQASALKRQQAQKLFQLKKAYDDSLSNLKTQKDLAMQQRRYDAIDKINKMRANLETWKNDTRKAIKEKSDQVDMIVKNAHDVANEQHSFLKAQELLQGNRVSPKSPLKYAQNYLGFHSLFNAMTNPARAVAEFAGAGMLSPKLAANIYKASRNIKVPGAIQVPMQALTKVLQNERVRQQLATRAVTAHRK